MQAAAGAPQSRYLFGTDSVRVLLVAGARPNFMKIAPILRSLDEAGEEAVLVHTGQHYDRQMSDAFFRDLNIRAPDHYLDVGSGSHAVQTARVMEAFEPVLEEVRPDWVVVVGDVNSTMACALVAVKLKSSLGCRVAHVEAGLRSHDWRMPEEVNRVVTDRVADLLLTPSPDATPNLVAEGIPEGRIRFVGNVMIDTLLESLPRARARGLPASAAELDVYALVTLHRPSNVDDRESLGVIFEALERLNDRLPVVFPMHPRTRRNAEAFGHEDVLGRFRVIDPVGYLEMLALSDRARIVVTDSGGLQEETTVLGVPCVTLREQTERPITLTEGTNRMAPWPLTVAGILESCRRAGTEGRQEVGAKTPAGWDGAAAARIVSALAEAGAVAAGAD